MAARKKTPRKKTATKKTAGGAEIAWRGRYEEAQTECDHLVEVNVELQQSLEAVLASNFGIDWPAKVEELGQDVTDQLRLILTTSRAQGRTRLMFNAVVRQTELENPPDYVAIVAAQQEHLKFLQGFFHEYTGSAAQGQRIESLHRTRVHFVTADEDRAHKLQGLAGVVRFFDHFTVEHTLARLLIK